MTAAAALWLTFFAGPGTIEVATLIVVVLVLVWFATVDPRRLVDNRRRPSLLLFGLAVLGVALLVTAASVMSTGTVLVTLAVGSAALVVGSIRAIRFGMDATIEDQ